MIEIFYKGVDITESVSINRCWHDMYAGEQSDTLFLRANDTERLWDNWSPATGDEIKVQYGAIGTGVMFVSSAIPKNGTYDITAQAAPASCFEKKHKAWQRVRLLQLGEEIARRNGLGFASYGVNDALYSYIMQNGEGDLQFLSRRAALEGVSVAVYDKRLIMYAEAYMEAQTPAEALEVTIDADYKYIDKSAELYGSCIVENGAFSGRFSAGNGSSRIYRPSASFGIVGSNDEAERFAKNLLRKANKDCYGGYVYSRIMPGYAAASTVELQNARAPSWDGSVFLHHIRNDYGKGKSKVFFRRPLEGY